MTPSVIEAEGISVCRGRHLVLHPCDLAACSGDRLAIFGPNGAGKSTMLKSLAGLLPIASGSIHFRGKALGKSISLLTYHRRTAAVFQEPLLLRGTVRHNVELGLRLRGIAQSAREEAVMHWLERLRIAHLQHRSVRTLSGGEAQRTSLARALVLDPEILFLDEPFAAVDTPTRARLVDDLADIFQERQLTTFLVTHDIGEAAALCGRCLVLDAGRVLQHDEMSAVLNAPSSQRVVEITAHTRMGVNVLTNAQMPNWIRPAPLEESP